MQEQNVHEKPASFSWVTVEVALYGILLIVALALRLGALGARIMDVSEARSAWQAWQLAGGGAPDGDYSPLLLTGQTLLFVLFGAGDAAARLWPALFGSAMVVWPYFVRSRLGRWGAWTSALVLAVSPTLVYSSRYGDGAMLLTACTLGAVLLWLRGRGETRAEARPAYWGAIAALAAGALLADPRVIAVLIAFALAWAVEKFLFARNMFAGDAERPVDGRRLAITLGATLALLATACAFNPRGLGVWADFPTQWAAHLAPVVNGQPWHYPLSVLFLYEPLLLVFGAIGAIDLLIRRDELSILTWMAVLLLAVALLSGGRDAGDVALVCALLALPVGRAVENLIDSWRREARLAREGAFVAVALVILVYLAFETTLYARALYIARPEAGQFLWLWLLAVSLILVLGGLYLAWFGQASTWRAGGAVLALVLVLLSFSMAVGLNFRNASNPRELHVRAASDEGVRDVLDVMRTISAQRYGYPISAPVTVEAGLGALWRWYLRDWERVEFVERLTPEVQTPMVLTSVARSSPTLGDRYTGQDFVTRQWWQPEQLASNDQLTWLLYRQSVTLPVKSERVILWVKAETQTANAE